MWILYDPLPWVVETSLQACNTSSAWLFDVVWLSLLGGKPSTAFTQAFSSMISMDKCRC